MEKQGQLQHDQKQECVENAKSSGDPIAPVFLCMINRVQSGDQAVNAQTGRPQSRNHRHTDHRADGVVGVDSTYYISALM